MVTMLKLQVSKNISIAMVTMLEIGLTAWSTKNA